MIITDSVRVSLYLVTAIPSVIASIINLYCLLYNQAFRTALNNHVVILVLLIAFFDGTTVVCLEYFWI
ncbi:hypothetical protein I4U23_015042 [Adineta vaga]|nr:hypothetical protein I4U23_015042 [Adineta vaga]